MSVLKNQQLVVVGGIDGPEREDVLVPDHEPVWDLWESDEAWWVDEPSLAGLGLDEISTEVLAEVSDQYKETFGRAALRELDGTLRAELASASDRFDASRGSYDVYIHAVGRGVAKDFIQRYTWRRLRLEREDQERRDGALAHRSGEGQYLLWAQQQMKVWQRLFRGRWYVPGVQDEDFRGAVIHELLEILRVGGEKFRAYERTGIQATFLVCGSVRKTLLRERNLHEVLPVQVLADFPKPGDTPSAEELLLRVEREEELQVLLNRELPARLSRRQREWLKAFRAYIEKWGTLSYDDVARALGKSRTSAWRASKQIRWMLEQLGEQASSIGIAQEAVGVERGARPLELEPPG